MLRKSYKEKTGPPAVSTELFGKVTHAVKRGMVVKTIILPKVGSPVFDSKKRRVGNVVDLFGPVKSPYALIKPAAGLTADDQRGLVGSEVFMGEIYGGKKGKK
jgi:rRNA processing protein Gar1